MTVEQFGRKASLLVLPPNDEPGYDLSELHFRFVVRAADVETPNTLTVRVWNVAPDVVARIRNPDFAGETGPGPRVKLQAGYEGNLAIIFDGTIKQTRSGKENPTDTYFDILAGDGDRPYNEALIRAVIAAGPLQGQARFDAIKKAFEDAGAATGGYIPPIVFPVAPRGRVLFGMARDGMRDLADSLGMSWSIQNGQLQLLPRQGYLPGQAVVLNAQTGLIGRPEQTENGIRAKCLLNPLIRIGGLVQIDNKSINQTTIREQGFPQYTSFSLPAPVTDEGVYRVYVADHFGDTRGQEWYSDLTCLAVDITAPRARAVRAAG
jgi:hypothetical protein